MPDLAEKLRSLLDTGKDVAQGASNAVAGNVSGPVDLISWGLRKAGLGNVIGQTPVGGSDWMAQRGITQQPKNALAGMAGETLGMTGPMVAAAKAPQVANGLIKMGENALAPATMNPQRGAIVYHGSPHSFDKFDMSKIGTGEGAQAYGHGLYLADSKGVAQSYADNLSAFHDPRGAVSDLVTEMSKNSPASSDLKTVQWYMRQDSRLRDYANNDQVVAQVHAAVHGTALDGTVNNQALGAFNQLDKALPKPSGQLYKVDLPDEHIAKMLDWDKPLSQQSPFVQKALEKTGTVSVRADKASYLASLSPQGRRTAAQMLADNPENLTNGTHDANWRSLMASDPKTDHNVIHDINDYVERAGNGQFLERALGGGPQASERMKQAGIPGIKYLDQGSRGAGDGTRNYVVFDDKLPQILERNGKSLADQLRDKLK